MWDANMWDGMEFHNSILATSAFRKSRWSCQFFKIYFIIIIMTTINRELILKQHRDRSTSCCQTRSTNYKMWVEPLKCFLLPESVDQTPFFLGPATAKQEITPRRELLHILTCHWTLVLVWLIFKLQAGGGGTRAGGMLRKANIKIRDGKLFLRNVQLSNNAARCARENITGKTLQMEWVIIQTACHLISHLNTPRRKE